MADPVVVLANGVPISGNGAITTLGQVLSALQDTTPVKVKSTSGAPAAVAIKAAAGYLKSLNLYCNSQGPVFIKFYNVAAGSVTVGTTTPVFTIGVSPGNPFAPNFGGGFPFSTAMSFAITGGIAENDATPVAVDDLVGLITFL